MQNAVVLIAFLGTLLAVCQAQSEPSIMDLCMASTETKELCNRILGSFQPVQEPQPQMEKRKASFIRFGKRSAPLEEYGMDNGDMQMNKRKASFIRFGRK